ncbi:hypothetical protein QKU48_gp0820 [Fadolivirus algeromassiliense]|jgi:hypothetical protein|uniref:Uncharacterized protein n=1 Tax=Fadolivirus FV1/VV64 TaxID=3070911 RepID=A0A7D3R279_9VIRU|nr:hypothetical protein QKU48_gp0820 [Fadolivirus algeromassiliense]QKF94278.1 hypothetical protein Fadolivirus_1_820 [Fadolivirus FV1/VV64]
MDYQTKYLKYKTKYLELKMSGGNTIKKNSHMLNTIIKFNISKKNSEICKIKFEKTIGGSREDEQIDMLIKKLDFISDEKKREYIAKNYYNAFSMIEYIMDKLKSEGQTSKLLNSLNKTNKEFVEFMKVTEMLTPANSKVLNFDEKNMIMTMETLKGKQKLNLIPVGIFNLSEKKLTQLFHVIIDKLPKNIVDIHEKLSKDMIDNKELEVLGYHAANITFKEEMSMTDTIFYMYLLSHMLKGIGFIQTIPPSNENLVILYVVKDMKKI